LALHGANNLPEGHQLIHRIGAMMKRLGRSRSAAPGRPLPVGR
jgi:hypothetical protein